MEDYQKRVLDEKHDLDQKIFRLYCFINSNSKPYGDSIFPTLSKTEQQLMKEQLQIMNSYSDILGKRIAEWEKE